MIASEGAISPFRSRRVASGKIRVGGRAVFISAGPCSCARARWDCAEACYGSAGRAERVRIMAVFLILYWGREGVSMKSGCKG